MEMLRAHTAETSSTAAATPYFGVAHTERSCRGLLQAEVSSFQVPTLRAHVQEQLGVVPDLGKQCSAAAQRVLWHTVDMNEELPLSQANCNSIVKNLLQVAVWHLLSFHPCTEGLQAMLMNG